MKRRVAKRRRWEATPREDPHLLVIRSDGDFLDKQVCQGEDDRGARGEPKKEEREKGRVPSGEEGPQFRGGGRQSEERSQKGREDSYGREQEEARCNLIYDKRFREMERAIDGLRQERSKYKFQECEIRHQFSPAEIQGETSDGDN